MSCGWEYRVALADEPSKIIFTDPDPFEVFMWIALRYHRIPGKDVRLIVWRYEKNVRHNPNKKPCFGPIRGYAMRIWWAKYQIEEHGENQKT